MHTSCRNWQAPCRLQLTKLGEANFIVEVFYFISNVELMEVEKQQLLLFV